MKERNDSVMRHYINEGMQLSLRLDEATVREGHMQVLIYDFAPRDLDVEVFLGRVSSKPMILVYAWDKVTDRMKLDDVRTADYWLFHEVPSKN